MSDTLYERQRAQKLPVFGLPQPLRIEPVELHQADLSNLYLCDKTTRDSQLQQTSLSTSDPLKACAPFATQSLRVNFLGSLRCGNHGHGQQEAWQKQELLLYGLKRLFSEAKPNHTNDFQGVIMWTIQFLNPSRIERHQRSRKGYRSPVPPICVSTCSTPKRGPTNLGNPHIHCGSDGLPILVRPASTSPSSSGLMMPDAFALIPKLINTFKSKSASAKPYALNTKNAKLKEAQSPGVRCSRANVSGPIFGDSEFRVSCFGKYKTRECTQFNMNIQVELFQVDMRLLGCC